MKIAKALASSLTIRFQTVPVQTWIVFSTHGLPTPWVRQAREEHADHMISHLIYSTSDVAPEVLVGWVRHGGTAVIPRVRHALMSTQADMVLARKVFS